MESLKNPTLAPVIDIHFDATFIKAENMMDFGENGLTMNVERAVDYESLRVNKKDVSKILLNQQWNHFFDMLNGPTCFDLVKKLWIAYVFDRKYANNQEALLLSKNPEAKGLTREQMGLEPFRRTKTRSTLLGMKVVITQAHTAKLLRLDNTGEVISEYKTAPTHQEAIKAVLFEPVLMGKEPEMYW
jgi:plasmid maintenance system killer protein